MIYFCIRIIAQQICAVLCSVIQIGFQIKTRVQELGHGCIFLVQKAGALQITPSDGFTKRELIECARAVTEKVKSYQQMIEFVSRFVDSHHIILILIRTSFLIH